ncbi:PA14 domain-containing protein [Bacillus sp. DX1.1]|nr:MULTISPECIES: PA14 domain-containing protein [unclassified Bacillus (in: firmicutes)]MDM5157511.1 PA14 domain-containing protein [Bacillus sp. DX1.1]WJE84191.1 PA14 domain-containing protein [Bacillus sp. DX3.1]
MWYVPIAIAGIFLTSVVVDADAGTFTQRGGNVHYNWGYDKPKPEVSADHFTAIFDQSQSLKAGDYFIHTLADDRVKVSFDGKNVIDRWQDEAGKIDRTIVKSVTDGNHKIQTKFYENTGKAAVFSDIVPFDHWLAYYYPNKNLEGYPVDAKVIAPLGNEKKLSEDNGYGSPASKVPADNFSARYTTVKRLPAGEYVIRGRVDDGVRVFIDGKLVLDRWGPGWSEEDARKIRIDDGTAGWAFGNANEKDTHLVEVQYLEVAGGSQVDFSIEPYKEEIKSKSWIGEFYNNKSLKGDAVVVGGDKSSEKINSLNFNWGYGVPHKSVPADNFSARFTKVARFETGDYMFTAKADDGIRVYVDDKIVIDSWKPSDNETRKVKVPMKAGDHKVKVEYLEASGNANVQVDYNKVPGPFYQKGGNAHYNWGYSGPTPAYPDDDFYAKFDQSRDLNAGDYFVHTLADDRVKVSFDGKNVIDRWTDKAGEINRALVTNVSQGNHKILTNYYENSGQAAIFSDFVPFDHWLAYYYPNTDLAGYPVDAKVIAPQGSNKKLAENNGTGAPTSKVPANNFSARYATVKRLTAGDYVIRGRADDGIRVFIDGRLVMDHWGPNGYTEYARKIHINDGTAAWAFGTTNQKDTHLVEVQYLEKTGSSRVEFSIEPYRQGTYPSSWLGEFYNNKDLKGESVIIGGNNALQKINYLNFDWKYGAPISGIKADDFSARFTKTEYFDGGDYTFSVKADDGIRVYVDDRAIINSWQSSDSGIRKAKVSLTKGQHKLRVEYFEGGGQANLAVDYYIDKPYETLDLRKPSKVTAQEINNYVSNKTNGSSPLIGYGQAFIDAQNKYGINALFLASHAILESGYGKSEIAYRKHNLFGLRAEDSDPFGLARYFTNFKASINYNAAYVREYYVEPGHWQYKGVTLQDINANYSTDKGWATKIANLMEEIHPYSPQEYNGVNIINQNGEEVVDSHKLPKDIPYTNYESNTKGQLKQTTNEFRSAPWPYPTSFGKPNNVLRTLSQGTVVDVLQKDPNKWIKIRVNGQEGWVPESLIKINENVDPLNGKAIIIDPGHGGVDNGHEGLGNGMDEDAVVLDASLRVRELFNRKSPFKVLLTRDGDWRPGNTAAESLKKRVEFAQQNNGDIFVSIHANGFNGDANGSESYYWSGRSSRSGNPHVEESKLLSEKIQKRLVEALETKDRGVKEGDLHVLRENTMPATLIELAFIDNEADNEKLVSEYWRQRAAEAIYSGILDYYESKGINVSAYRL